MKNLMKSKMPLVAAVVVIIAVAGLMIFFAQNPRPVSTPLRHSIVDNNITVNAGSYAYYNFRLSNTGNVYPTMTGSFIASSDESMERPLIRVFVMTNANFTAWQNQNSAGTIYDSAFVHDGDINANLPMNGEYVLVYDNTFDSISKTVNTVVYIIQV